MVRVEKNVALIRTGVEQSGCRGAASFYWTKS